MQWKVSKEAFYKVPKGQKKKKKVNAMLIWIFVRFVDSSNGEMGQE